MAEFYTIPELNPTLAPARDHEVWAARNFLDVRLTLGQILGLAKGTDVKIDSITGLGSAANVQEALAAIVGNQLSTPTVANRLVKTNNTTGGLVQTGITINANNQIEDSLTLLSTDGGAGQGPVLELRRESASPAASDGLGMVRFWGRSSTGVTTQAAQLFASLLDPTNGAHSSSLNFNVWTAGSIVGALTLRGDMMYVGVPLNLTTDLGIAHGGTGASSASDARTNLGLGTMATQNKALVDITGGTIAGITDLAVADGGTGASDAAGARTNLGLGTMATQNAGAVSITGGQLDNINIDDHTISAVQVFKIGTWATAQYLAQWGWATGQMRWAWWLAGNGGLQLMSFDGAGAQTGTALNINNMGSAIQTPALSVLGALSKQSGTFWIDHPLDPANKDLVHGFVEGPEHQVRYRGKIQLEDGQATVNIDAAWGMTDGTFAALTKNAEVMSLRNKTSFAPCICSDVEDGEFTITCQDDTSTAWIVWEVAATRNDTFVRSVKDKSTDENGDLIIEPLKPETGEF